MGLLLKRKGKRV